MSDLEKRIKDLEEMIEDLQLDQHASRVAISVLSTAANSLANQKDSLGDVFFEAVSKAGPIKYESPVAADYEDKLNAKVASLLGKRD